MINLSWVSPPCPSPYTVKCVISCTPCPRMRKILPLPSLPCYDLWWIVWTIVFTHMWNIMTVYIVVWSFISYRERKTKKGWIILHLGMCNSTPQTQIFPSEFTGNVSFYIPRTVCGIENCLLVWPSITGTKGWLLSS